MYDLPLELKMDAFLSDFAAYGPEVSDQEPIEIKELMLAALVVNNALYVEYKEGGNV